MMRKVPGKIQEARRPGGARSLAAIVSKTSESRISRAEGGDASVTRTPPHADRGPGLDPCGGPSPASAPPPDAAPWMGLVLPAVTKNVSVAVSALRSAEVVALPTDTLYGFAGDARSAVAVERIYELKGRDVGKPLPICVADIADVGAVADVDFLPPGLLEALLPGPVTLVLPCRPASGLTPAVLAGSQTVGVRIPDATFVRAVARAMGGPLALTSANLSSKASPVCVEEFKPLWADCACVLDGGPVGGGLRGGSTIVRLLPSSTSNGVCNFTLLREGSAKRATLECLSRFGLTLLE